MSDDIKNSTGKAITINGIEQKTYSSAQAVPCTVTVTSGHVKVVFTYSTGSSGSLDVVKDNIPSHASAIGKNDVTMVTVTGTPGHNVFTLH